MASLLDNLEARSVPWNIRDAALGFGIVLAGLVAVAAVLALSGVTDAEAASQNTTLTLLLTGLVAVLMIGVGWLLGVRKYGVSWDALGFVRPRGRYPFLLAALALGVSIGFTALYSVTVDALGIGTLQPEALPGVFTGQNGQERVLAILVLAVLGPLGEEVFFRGFLFGALAKIMRVVPALAATGALFALGHVEVSVLIPIFVTGLALTWLYARTGSIWPPFAAHLGQNLIAVVASFGAT
ncbi:MAG: CPBP family intramembrane metalloprotease [SAR202 cluster bacterium]|nr:CPBP family intramembrane metalloprotease [SAR202 cluster bacterium]